MLRIADIGDATCTNLGHLHARVSIVKAKMYLDVPEYMYTDAGMLRVTRRPISFPYIVIQFGRAFLIQFGRAYRHVGI